MKLKFYFLYLFNATLILEFSIEKNVESEIPLYSEGQIREIDKKKNEDLEYLGISKNNDYFGQCNLNYNLEKHENESLSEENEDKKKSIQEELKNDTQFTNEEPVNINNLNLGKLTKNKNNSCENDITTTINDIHYSSKDEKLKLTKTSLNSNICLNESYLPYYSKKYLTLIYHPSYEYYNEKLFYYLIEKIGFKDAFSQLLNRRKNVAIFNLFNTNNYGAILTAYALQTILLNLGYNPYLIGEAIEENSFTLFINENLFSGGINGFNVNLNKLKKLNKYYDNFVVGSDQVWRFEYTVEKYEVLYLSFVEKNKNKIACAASFGIDHWEGSRKLLRKIRKYIKSFNKITVREKSGVNICKNTFKSKAKAIFDPVFYLKKDDWNKLLEQSTLNLSTYSLIYILNGSEKITNQINSIVEKMNLIQYWINIGSTSIYDFLKGIQSSQRVITDSFHGLCFSIIFHKDFICLCNKSRGEERFISLLSDLGLMNRLFYDLSKVNWEKLPPIDYSLVDKIIEQKRQEGIQFLQSNLK
ncbi:polysaccharide pyruvyl transferase-domain-containing protein [Neocallimastix sp. 'constans']